MGPERARERALPALPPAAGAVVMGTAIVSIDLTLAGQETLSLILLGIGIGLWLAIGALLGARAIGDLPGLAREARSPAALTGVAGTAVLGTRLVQLGAAWAGVALLVIALALWLGLIGGVLRHWITPTIGSSFVLTVGTQSLAVLAATLALSERAEWLLAASLVPFALGLAFYVFVLSRFDLRQLVVGLGDHWVAGGALAISTLAAGRIAIAARDLGTLGGGSALLEAIVVILWIATLLWLPVLVVAEAVHPRRRYDIRRWSTVFPVGMYSACSFVAGSVAGAGAIEGFARVWTWPALVVWAVVFVGMLRRIGAQMPRSPAPM